MVASSSTSTPTSARHPIIPHRSFPTSKLPLADRPSSCPPGYAISRNARPNSNRPEQATRPMDQNIPQLNARQSALLLMDFQPAVLGSLDEPTRSAVVERAQTALSWARSQGLAVVHVRVAFTEADLAGISANNRAFAGLPGTGMLVDGSPGCEIIDDLKPERDEMVVRKIRFGAFSTTDLGAQLRGAGIESLLLAGVSTSGVVLSTIRDAADQ